MSDETSQQARARALRRHIKTFLRRFGLHRQHRTPCGQPLSVPHAHALMRLLEAEENGEERKAGLRISELGAHLNVDKSNVSRLCGRMEERGHIERRPCPDDGRAKRIWLTDEGREVAEQVEAASLERFAGLLEAMEEEAAGEEGAGEVESLFDSLTMLNDALERTNNDS